MEFVEFSRFAKSQEHEKATMFGDWLDSTLLATDMHANGKFILIAPTHGHSISRDTSKKR